MSGGKTISAITPSTPVNGYSPGKKNRLKDRISQEQLDKFNNVTRNAIAIPISSLSAASGLASFALAQYGGGANETLDMVAEKAGRGAILANSIFGGVTNVIDYNASGSFGYLSDIFASWLAPPEYIYTWRGIGTAFDQLPLFNEVLNDHPEIRKRYNLKEGEMFSDYNSFTDSVEKYAFGIKLSMNDLVNDVKTNMKSGAYHKAIIAPFAKPQYNLFTTAVGALSGASMAIFFGVHELGARVRDVFGLLCDFAVIHGGLAGNKGKETGKGASKGDMMYVLSGGTYTVGTLADLLYRFKPMENLHFAALGIDRLGALFMAIANNLHNQDARNNGKVELAKDNSGVSTPEITPALSV